MPASEAVDGDDAVVQVVRHEDIDGVDFGQPGVVVGQRARADRGGDAGGAIERRGRRPRRPTRDRQTAQRGDVKRREPAAADEAES